MAKPFWKSTKINQNPWERRPKIILKESNSWISSKQHNHRAIEISKISWYLMRKKEATWLKATQNSQQQQQTYWNFYIRPFDLNHIEENAQAQNVFALLGELIAILFTALLGLLLLSHTRCRRRRRWRCWGCFWGVGDAFFFWRGGWFLMFWGVRWGLLLCLINCSCWCFFFGMMCLLMEFGVVVQMVLEVVMGWVGLFVVLAIHELSSHFCWTWNPWKRCHEPHPDP